MKLLAFTVDGRSSYGILKGAAVTDAGARWGATYPNLSSLLAPGAMDGLRKLAADSPTDYALTDIRLLKPLPCEGKILCVGINYHSHDESQGVAELPKYPTLFFRLHSTLVAHGEQILRPPESNQLDFEGEIVLLIGKKGRRIAEPDAASYIAGYTICDEGTVRDWQRHAKGSNVPGKNFERSGAIGPWIATPDEIPPGPMRVTTRVNGFVRQDDTTEHMLFSFPYLISYISRFCTLEPGDIISTGTPPGTGQGSNPPRYLVPGDTVEVEVPGIGTLRNTVADEVVAP
jgi:2-keto-4-pentenoate hydratase/2-oxohepta-3-ene-1,7-dioic acid hydratase in catechol pathway